jgi:hypothetical protein
MLQQDSEPCFEGPVRHHFEGEDGLDSIACEVRRLNDGLKSKKSEDSSAYLKRQAA